MLINGYWNRTPAIRSFFSALSFGTWLYIATIVINSEQEIFFNHFYVFFLLFGDIASAFFAGFDVVHAERSKDGADR